MDIVIANLPAIALAVLCILALAYQIAIGRGQQLADSALAFLLTEAQATLDRVSREDLDLAVAFLYNAAPGMVGPVPWKRLVSVEMCQGLAWEAWQRLHELADSAGGMAIRRAVKQGRLARSRG